MKIRDLTDPIISDDEEVGVNLQDELESTPVLKDETTKTAMQQCQEKEEKQLWDEIGSTTDDPEGKIAQSDEDKKAEAEHYKMLDFCDRSYYGEQGCREWKRQIDSVPLTPEAKLDLETQRQIQMDLCPVNLIKLTDCQRAKQSIYMRFAVPKTLTETVEGKFKPGRPVDVIPRLDFMIAGQGSIGAMTGAQLVPLPRSGAPAPKDDLSFKPVSIPRLPDQVVPKPSTRPGSEGPRIPTGSDNLDTQPSKPGSDIPRLPSWEFPGRDTPKASTIPSHDMPHDQIFKPPAIEGHTVPPFRPPPQGKL